MPKCPRCGSPETVTLGIKEVIDSDREGDLVTQQCQCVKCRFVFDFDDFVPRPERTVEQ